MAEVLPAGRGGSGAETAGLGPGRGMRGAGLAEGEGTRGAGTAGLPPGRGGSGGAKEVSAAGSGGRVWAPRTRGITRDKAMRMTGVWMRFTWTSSPRLRI